jgi:hypothetical protein
MKTCVEVAGAFIEFALYWSIEDWAKGADWMRLLISVFSDWAHFSALVTKEQHNPKSFPLATLVSARDNAMQRGEMEIIKVREKEGTPSWTNPVLSVTNVNQSNIN